MIGRMKKGRRRERAEREREGGRERDGRRERQRRETYVYLIRCVSLTQLMKNGTWWRKYEVRMGSGGQRNSLS